MPAIDAAFIKERETEARNFAGRGQCEKIARSWRAARRDYFPDAKAAVEKAGAHCTQAAVAAPNPSTSPGEEPASSGNVDQLIADAREAARNANWIEARKKADEVLRSSPDNQDALSVAGVAACNLADKDRAQKYMSRLKGARQNMMKQILREPRRHDGVAPPAVRAPRSSSAVAMRERTIRGASAGSFARAAA